MSYTSAERINQYLKYLPHKSHESIHDEIAQEAKIAHDLERLSADSFLNYRPFYFFDIVRAEDIDEYFNNTSMDIESSLNAVKLTDAAIISSKNAVLYLYDGLRDQTNKLSSLIDKVALYNNASFSNIFSVVENFNSEEDIVVNDGLLVDVFENKLTLNIDKIENIDLNKATINIGPASNGSPDNINTLSNIYDGSDLSYFYYYQDNSVDRLNLHIDIRLQNLSIINQLLISPNNFGTQNWLNVLDISTSIDGETYHSIYDSSNFYRRFLFNNKSLNNFILSPELNKLSNKFIFNFQPTKAQYVRISLSQPQLNPISDKFEIGINEIEISKASYNTSGSIVIRKPINLDILKSLSLHIDSRSTIDSEILPSSYKVSFDSVTWHDIQPVESSGSKPEVLNFNQEWLSDSIDIGGINSEYIYLKIFLSRITDPSKIQSILSNYSIRTSEFREFPTSSPYTINLTNPAISGSENLFAMPFIGVGKTGYNYLTLERTSPNNNYYTINLPFNPGPLSSIKIGNIKIDRYYDISDLIDGNNLGYYINEDEYLLHLYIPKDPIPKTGEHKEPWIIYKQNNEEIEITRIQKENYEDNNEVIKYTDDAKVVLSTFERLRNNRPINLVVDAEQKTLSSRIFQLSYNCDSKEGVEIQRIIYDNTGNIKIESVSDYIPAGVKSIKLSALPMKNRPYFLDEGVPYIRVIGGHMVDYIDGFEEFIDANAFAYSIDFENQMLYLRDEYKVNVSIRYYRELIFDLDQNDFDLAADNKTITIRDWAFDLNAEYRIKYNMSVLIPKKYYSVSPDKSKIILSDDAIKEVFYGISDFKDKKLKIVYNYNENYNNVLKDIINNISPIITKASINYSVVE